MCAGRLKQELNEFSGEVQKIFVDSSVAVIDSVRGLVNSAFDDLKGAVDTAAGKTQAAGDRATRYVRENPWKAAVAFLAVSFLITAISNRKRAV